MKKIKITELRREIMLFRYHLRKSLVRIKQVASSKRRVNIQDRTVHIVCVNKKEYLKAGIRCANSIWLHSPEVRIEFHLDPKLNQEKKLLFRKLDRPDRATVKLETDFKSWQELKLRVILYELNEQDIFSDADLYWNSTIPMNADGLYFASEKAALTKFPYGEIIKACDIALNQESFMANSSVIKLGRIFQKNEFVHEVERNFHKLRIEAESGDYPEQIRAKILRLSEQISLSISINTRIDHFKALKITDKPMDGGLAESYYLGTTKGWG